MKTEIQLLLTQALQALHTQGFIDEAVTLDILIDHTKDKKFGDFSSNIAMVLSKQTRKNPRELAAKIIENLQKSPNIAKVEIAGPGFINFYLTETALHSVIGDILTQKENFGRVLTPVTDKKIHIEYVSANPTGPLHVGHGRSAAFGSALCNLLKANGISLHVEYYVNDAGRQMDILAASVWLRYLELCGLALTFPSNGYQGDYVLALAKTLYAEQGDKLIAPIAQVLEGVCEDQTESHPDGDKEAHIDGIIDNAKKILGAENYLIIFNLALNHILSGIRTDLKAFGVEYDRWFSEKSLFDEGYIYKTIEILKSKGYTYEKEGNLWFKATDFGDEKDRVLIRKNGIPTYFANDISYHLSKFERGATDVIDVLGADHHGYIPRIKASMQALGIDPDRVNALFVQFAILYRGEERVQMSTRSGSFVTLSDLQKEVGKDAARYFYIMRKNEQHLDFDLELAKSKSNENPVYYIQYAYARIASVLRQAEEKGIHINQNKGLENLALLLAPQEKALIECLSQYPETILSAGLHYEPHQLCHYLRELASSLHGYYNALSFLVEDDALCQARLVLILATQQVIYNGLTLLSIHTPEKM